MSFQVGIGSLGGTVFFSRGTLYPSVNYGVLLGTIAKPGGRWEA